MKSVLFVNLLVQFGDEGFHERGEAAYCKKCYFGQFAPRCGWCGEPITENFISSLNKQVSSQDPLELILSISF